VGVEVEGVSHLMIVLGSNISPFKFLLYYTLRSALLWNATVSGQKSEPCRSP